MKVLIVLLVLLAAGEKVVPKKAEPTVPGFGTSEKKPAPKKEEPKSEPTKKKEPAKKEEPKKSFRFRTALERLPKGLPEWFFEYDLNQDGQIEMFEWTDEWTEEAAQEFQEYDLNNDGIITPEECLKVEAAKKAEELRKKAEKKTGA